jgi:hypothetical protein
LLTLVLSSSDSSEKLEEPIHTHLQNEQPLRHSAMANVNPHLSRLLNSPYSGMAALVSSMRQSTV